MDAALHEDGAELWEICFISTASMTEASTSLPAWAAAFRDDGDKVMHLEVTDDPRDEEFATFTAVLQEATIKSVLDAITLNEFQFSHGERFQADLLNPFFGEVLPTLPILRTVELVDCTLPSTVLGQLAGAEALATSALRELVLQDCTIDTSGIDYLASIVRWGPPLHRLVVHPKRTGNVGLEPEECLNLCNAVFESRHLRNLEIKVNTIEAGTLGRIFEAYLLDSAGNLNESESSPLRSLSINAHFSREGFEAMARSLRSNIRLRSLFLVDRKIELRQHLPLLEETLRMYNHTLRVVEVELDTRVTKHFEDILHQNKRLHAAHDLLVTRRYTLPQPSLWLRAVHIMRSKPPLLYRLVRSNIPIMTEIVTNLHTKKRAAVQEPNTRVPNESGA
jgi:hypothetical protein